MESPVCSDACGSHTYSTCKECREYVCGSCLLAHVCHPELIKRDLPDDLAEEYDREEAENESFSNGCVETNAGFARLLDRLSDLEGEALLVVVNEMIAESAKATVYTVEDARDVLTRHPVPPSPATRSLASKLKRVK